MKADEVAVAPKKSAPPKKDADEVTETPVNVKKGLTFDPNKTYEFELVKDKGSRYWSLTQEDETIDPDTGKRRVMRYVPHFDSIWRDEQPTDVRVNLSENPLNFWMGYMKISGAHNENLFNYLMLHSMSADNKNRINANKAPYFRLNNPDAKAEANVAAKFNLNAALKVALTLSEEDTTMIAYILFGKKFDNDTLAKSAIADYASRNSDAFLKIAEDPRNKRKFAIRTGIDNGVLAEKNGMLVWGMSGVKIMQLNPEKNIVEQATDYSLSDDGKEFFTILKRSLAQ